jgi:Flp pilus assembly protein TadD
VKPWIVSLLLVTVLTGPSVAATKPAKSDKSDKKAAAAPDSLKLLEQAVAKDSTKFENLLALGAMYLDRDRPLEAQRVLYKANQVRSKNMKVLVNLGAAYDASGDAADAQRYYREALAVTPGDELATCRLASSLYAQAKQAEAMGILRDMIRDK